MKVKYINKENHEVVDSEVWLFHENEVHDLPDRLGQYLIFKFPASFIQAHEAEPATNKPEIKESKHILNPTKRFMIEPSLVCNIKCKMCYHLHRYETWKDTVKPFEKMKQEILKGKERGNEWMDITGGEPTIYPYIIDIIKYAKSIGLNVCIITNGIVTQKKTEQLIEAGIDEFLVSRHGLEENHNLITNNKDSYKKQLRFLNQIKDKVNIRFNCVITQLNQNDFEKIAKEIAVYNPKIVNFINMNLHHEWKNCEFESKEIIANLKIVEKNLNKAIDYLEAEGIGVNLRYYPMCRIKDIYRRCVCNDLHVMFDSYEWDYNVTPKTKQVFYEWGVNTSRSNEEKGDPCNECDLQNICGGINKYFHKYSIDIHGEVCKLQKVENIDKMDYTYYRKNANTV